MVTPFTYSNEARNRLMIWNGLRGKRPSTQPIKPTSLTAPVQVNNMWTNEITYAMERVGDLDGSGETARPVHPYIIDLTTHPLGWRLLEGAHALAHRIVEVPKPAPTRKDIARMSWSTERRGRVKRVDPAPSPQTVRECLVRLCVGLTYGMPIDVRPKDIFQPTCAKYGIHVTTGSFRSPMMQIPVVGDGSPIPDKSIAYILGGVHTEPHPHGYTSGSGQWKPINMWSCSPTMVVIAGWELVSGIIGMQPTEPEWSRGIQHVAYSALAPALQPPDTFKLLLDIAEEERGRVAGEREGYAWHVKDWLQSEDYEDAVGAAPPLPCTGCIAINRKTPGAPERPRCPRPEKKRGRKKSVHEMAWDEKLWYTYDKQIERIEHIIHDAVVTHEAGQAGWAETGRARRKRTKANKERLKKVKKAEILNRKIERAIKNGEMRELVALTKERQVYDHPSQQGGEDV